MDLSIKYDKSIEENAAIYFEKAKKAKKKLRGAKRALLHSQEKLAKLKEKKEIASKKLKTKVEKNTKEKEWYEKFRWFFSSEDFLCIGGRDATSNEVLVKKYTEEEDVVFHAKLEGSPFFVVRTKGKQPGEQTLKETAQATASYSKAWRMGVAGLETIHMKPDQLSKQAPSGEYVPKGAFMIRGSTHTLIAELKVAVGIKDGKNIGGPVEAIKKHAEKYMVLKQGRKKTGAIAKIIHKHVGGNLDDIIRFIPAGGCEVESIN